MRREKAVWLAGALVLFTALPGFGLGITANDDVSVWGGAVRDEYDAYAGKVLFGLFAAGGDRAYVEFTLGATQAQSAKLSLYNYWYGGIIGNPGVDGTTTIQGAAASFSENDSSAMSLGDAGWPVLGSFPMTVGQEVGFYNVDITSFYNANLGQTVTMAISFAGSGAAGSGDGPIFEDRELTAYWGGMSTQEGGAPLVDVTEIPEPASLLLLVAGLCVVRRRR